MIATEELMSWVFDYTTQKFQALRGIYKKCTLKIDVGPFPAGSPIDEIQIDYQYGIMEFIRVPVSAMDKHQSLASFTILLLVEGLDYEGMQARIRQEEEEAQGRMPQEEYTTEPASLFEERPSGGFESADVALSRFNLPDFSSGFVRREDGDESPVNR